MASLKAEKPVGTLPSGQVKKEPAVKASDGGASKPAASKPAPKKAAAKPQESKKRAKAGGKSAAKH